MVALIFAYLKQASALSPLCKPNLTVSSINIWMKTCIFIAVPKLQPLATCVILQSENARSFFILASDIYFKIIEFEKHLKQITIAWGSKILHWKIDWPFWKLSVKHGPYFPPQL